jgi:hypothetical protein
MTVNAISSQTQVSPIVQVAEALERLTARVERDCNVEASEGVGPLEPQWARVLDELAVVADQCRAVLDQPDVLTALTIDPAW